MNYQSIDTGNFSSGSGSNLGKSLLESYLKNMLGPSGDSGVPAGTWTDPTTNTMNAPGALSAMQGAGAQSYTGMKYTAGTGVAPADNSY